MRFISRNSVSLCLDMWNWGNPESIDIAHVSRVDFGCRLRAMSESSVDIDLSTATYGLKVREQNYLTTFDSAGSFATRVCSATRATDES